MGKGGEKKREGLNRELDEEEKKTAMAAERNPSSDTVKGCFPSQELVPEDRKQGDEGR